ncbi:MAG: ribonuclease P protein component [Moraxella sp.]|uniref:ribonuclease P protein component n=1 Tax=Moraxella sp. TaxID=479 RepID=UPI0026DC59B3|nr:ribonuclease P protein component [Moraxella sp.]MDO4449535.1 ribonuclease P protein component [Moraxella sp.]
MVLIDEIIQALYHRQFTHLSIMTDPTFSFAKTKRLLAPCEFKAVFDNPVKKIHSTHFLLFVANTEYPHARLGLAITKKKLKKAVDRTQLKRHTREIFRLNQHDLPPVDCVLIVKSGAFVGTKQQKVDKDTAWATAKAELVDMFGKLSKLSHTSESVSKKSIVQNSLITISDKSATGDS